MNEGERESPAVRNYLTCFLRQHWAVIHLKMFVVKNAHKLKSLSEKAEKLRELNTHFMKLREILGTAEDVKDTERRIKAPVAEVEGR